MMIEVSTQDLLNMLYGLAPDTKRYVLNMPFCVLSRGCEDISGRWSWYDGAFAGIDDEGLENLYRDIKPFCKERHEDQMSSETLAIFRKMYPYAP